MHGEGMHTIETHLIHTKVLHHEAIDDHKLVGMHRMRDLTSSKVLPPTTESAFGVRSPGEQCAGFGSRFGLGYSRSGLRSSG